MSALGRLRPGRVAAPVAAEPATLVIEPRQPGPAARLRELWHFRGLLPFFGKRALAKLYVRTKLGWVWVPLRPLLAVSIRVLIFGALLKAPSDGIPYFLFFLVGISVWVLFSQSLMFITRSIDLNSKLVKKMYFPRLLLPVSGMTPGLAEFGVYIVLILLTLIGFKLVTGDTHVDVGLGMLLIPAGLVMCLALALGIGLWTSIFGTHGRDTRWTLSYVLHFWFLLTPVIYPLSAVPSKYQNVVALNPLAAPVEMVKLGFFGVGELHASAVLASVIGITLALGSGLWFFSKSEAISLDNL